MANKKVNIEITTTSNTSGADKAAASLDKVAAQQAKAAAKAEEVAVREAARLARSEAAAQKAVDVETRRQERLARQAEVAVQRKEAALRREEVAMARAQAAAEKAAQATERANQKAIDSAEALARKNEEVVRKEEANAKRLSVLAQNKDTSRTGSKVQQAGYQVADFATQVGGGTSAIQALGQQLPQFLGAFGPWGAVIGAAVAVLGALGKAIYEVAQDTKAGEEAFKRNSEMVKVFAEAYKKAGEQEVQSLTDKLSNQKDKLDALQEAEIGNIKVKGEVRDINGEIKTSYLNAEEAALKYLVQSGQVKGAEEALLQIERERIQLAKDAATAAANQKLEIARKQLQDAKDDKAAVEQDLIRLSKQANDAAQQLRIPTIELNAAKDTDKYNKLKEPSIETQRLQAIVDGINNKLEKYENAISQTNASFADLDLAISNANTNVDQVQTTLAAEINKINTQASLTETTTKLTQATDKQTQEVTKIKEALTSFEAVTPVQAEAKAKLLAAVSGGIITAEEQRQIGGSLQTLMATLRTGQTSTREYLQELITINNSLASEMTSAKNAIRDLNGKVQYLQSIK